ncbi:hypothetical protein TNCV_2533811 [Trichonephila clavipes]|nr:hypothetical protein TNCV_2533811 [Trichonephila clavipes]
MLFTTNDVKWESREISLLKASISKHFKGWLQNSQSSRRCNCGSSTVFQPRARHLGRIVWQSRDSTVLQLTQIVSQGSLQQISARNLWRITDRNA